MIVSVNSQRGKLNKYFTMSNRYGRHPILKQLLKISNISMNGSNVAIKILVLILIQLAHASSREFSFRLIQSDNIQRQELLQRRCDKYDSDNNELLNYKNNDSIHTMSETDLEHLLIDKKHKFLYCYVPKVSSIRIHRSDEHPNRTSHQSNFFFPPFPSILFIYRKNRERKISSMV